jgi:V-type H+-transporting ATPase proteolipid subunit
MGAALHWRMLLIRACKFNKSIPINSKLIDRIRFVKILVIEIFSSVLGLFGLIIGLLLSERAIDFK